MRAVRPGRECPQTFAGADDHSGLLLVGHSLTRLKPDGALVAARPASARALALLSLADFQGATLEVGAVEGLHCAGRVGIWHLHEAEPARATRVAIGDQRDLLDRSVLGKQGIHGLIGRGKGQISDI